MKIIIWIASLSSGTSGGVLAPLLMIGASMGTLIALVIPGHDSSTWAIVGMAALMGGTMRAPVYGYVLCARNDACLELGAAKYSWGALRRPRLPWYWFRVRFSRRNSRVAECTWPANIPCIRWNSSPWRTLCDRSREAFPGAHTVTAHARVRAAADSWRARK